MDPMDTAIFRMALEVAKENRTQMHPTEWAVWQYHLDNCPEIQDEHMPRHFEVNEDDPAARDFFVALNHVVFSKVLADACDCLLLEIQKWVGELEAEKKDVEAVLRTVNSEYFRAEGRFYRCRLKFRQKDYYCRHHGFGDFPSRC
ncbi:unnamed protein product [Effrenium voratum]|uniref:Uncharacterized protein n=1 Tax=Effrenium voratum TaxID=2562239 RepID=A0AA36N2Q0_9DINO|nr:unnamed protein product [Effrenium voratum]